MEETRSNYCWLVVTLSTKESRDKDNGKEQYNLNGPKQKCELFVKGQETMR